MPAGRTCGSAAARPPSGSPFGPAWWTSCTWPSSRSCSARASGSSTTASARPDLRAVPRLAVGRAGATGALALAGDVLGGEVGPRGGEQDPDVDALQRQAAGDVAPEDRVA